MYLKVVHPKDIAKYAVAVSASIPLFSWYGSRTLNKLNQQNKMLNTYMIAGHTIWFQSECI